MLVDIGVSLFSVDKVAPPVMEYIESLPAPLLQVEKQALVINARWQFMQAQENIKLQEQFLKPSSKPKVKKPNSTKKGVAVATPGRFSRQHLCLLSLVFSWLIFSPS